ncbi:MAG: alpha/beta hydrolase family protein [Candidatus Hodarchaeota archaeon]
MKVVRYLIIGLLTTSITSLLLVFTLLYDLWGNMVLTGALFAFVFIQSLLLVFFIPRYWSGNWKELMDESLLEIEKISIPMKDGYKLVTTIIKKKNLPDTPRPAIVMLHGANDAKEDLYVYAHPLALIGHIVICPDARGYGENEDPSEKKSKKNKGIMDSWIENSEKSIKSDLVDILDYVEGLENVNMQKIGVLGHSMGAVAGFMTGLVDQRIKIAICLSCLYTFVEIIEDEEEAAEIFSMGWFFKNMLSSVLEPEEIAHLEKEFSPRYQIKKLVGRGILEKFRFIHALDDELIPYENSFKLLNEDIKLPEKHYLLLEKGKHNLRGQETLVIAQVVRWFEDVLR